MSDGVSGWYGFMAFLVIAGGILTVGGILGAAAIRLMVRDDYFKDPD